MWAQRNNIIFLTICLEDCKNPEIKIDNDKVYFHGLGGTEKKNHQVTIELYKEIDPEVFIRCVKVVILHTTVENLTLLVNLCPYSYNLQTVLFLSQNICGRNQKAMVSVRGYDEPTLVLVNLSHKMVIDKNVLTFCGAVCVLVVGSFAF
jgi:hypothetical protein